jgi:hypothetical protein
MPTPALPLPPMPPLCIPPCPHSPSLPLTPPGHHVQALGHVAPAPSLQLGPAPRHVQLFQRGLGVVDAVLALCPVDGHRATLAVLRCGDRPGCMCVCVRWKMVCVCVCVCERERERERATLRRDPPSPPPHLFVPRASPEVGRGPDPLHRAGLVRTQREPAPGAAALALFAVLWRVEDQHAALGLLVHIILGLGEDGQRCKKELASRGVSEEGDAAEGCVGEGGQGCE